MSDRPLCAVCNRNLAEKGRATCRTHRTSGGRITPNSKLAYRLQKKDYCEECGLTPTHKCVLDVDHRDGNKKNSDPSNLFTICANCHRIKSCENEDTRPLKYRSKT